MSTSSTNVPMSKKDKIKLLRRSASEPVKGILTAEAILWDAQVAAAPTIAALIATSGNPSHRITVDHGTPKERKVSATFRKIGDYIGDKDGKPCSSVEPGAKALPVYGTKITEDDEDDE